MDNLNLPPRMAHGIERLIGGKIPEIKIRLKPGGIYTDILSKGKAVLTNDHDVMLNMARNASRTILSRYFGYRYKNSRCESTISVPLKSDSEIIGLLASAGMKLLPNWT